MTAAPPELLLALPLALGVLLCAALGSLVLGRSRTGLDARSTSARVLGGIAGTVAIGVLSALAVAGVPAEGFLSRGAVATLGPGIAGLLLIGAILLGDRRTSPRAEASPLRTAPLRHQGFVERLPRVPFRLAAGVFGASAIASVLTTFTSRGCSFRCYTFSGIPSSRGDGSLTSLTVSPYPGLAYTGPLWLGLLPILAALLLSIRSVLRTPTSAAPAVDPGRARTMVSLLGAASLTGSPASVLGARPLQTAEGVFAVLAGLVAAAAALTAIIALAMVLAPGFFAAAGPAPSSRVPDIRIAARSLAEHRP